MSNAFTAKPDLSAWTKQEQHRHRVSKHASKTTQTNANVRIVLDGSSKHLPPKMMRGGKE